VTGVIVVPVTIFLSSLSLKVNLVVSLLAKMTIFDLPLVDFGQFNDGTPEQREHAAKGVVYSFLKHGFVRLKNHGVSKDFVEEIWKWVCH
jgi:non-haem dioxygenase in morphine synthesis N-terminal